MADTDDMFTWAISTLDAETQRSLRRVAAWADVIEIEWLMEECDGIGFRKGEKVYWHLLEDGWDGDDPRDAMIADLDAEIANLKGADRG